MSKEKILGYLICESTIPADYVVIGESEIKLPTAVVEALSENTVLNEAINASGVSLVTIEANLQDMDIVNRNNRKYYQKYLMPALRAPHIQELIEAESWFGEAGHPHKADMTRQLTIDPTLISHKIKSISAEGNVVKGIVQAIPTKHGFEFDALIRSGAKVAFSLRAMGAVKNIGGVNEVIGNMRVVTYDWVILPSHKTAYQTNILSEAVTVSRSGELIEQCIAESCITPIGEDGIVKYITENSNNIKEMTNDLGFIYDRVILSENKRKVTLLSENSSDKLVVFLEDYLLTNYDKMITEVLKK